MPSVIRPAFATLWNLDLAFADVVSTSGEPALGAIRMAWWRERLEGLDQGEVLAEPRLNAINRQLLSRGVTGTELSKLEDAWLPLLEPFPWGEAVATGLRLRGRILFGIGARLLAGSPERAAGAGELWSLVDAANHCSDPRSRALLIDEAGKTVAGLPHRVETELRPLTILAALAASEVCGGGGIRRGAAVLAHRLRGGFPGGV